MRSLEIDPEIDPDIDPEGARIDQKCGFAPLCIGIVVLEAKCAPLPSRILTFGLGWVRGSKREISLIMVTYAYILRFKRFVEASALPVIDPDIDALL